MSIADSRVISKSDITTELSAELEDIERVPDMIAVKVPEVIRKQIGEYYHVECTEKVEISKNASSSKKERNKSIRRALLLLYGGIVNKDNSTVSINDSSNAEEEGDVESEIEEDTDRISTVRIEEDRRQKENSSVIDETDTSTGESENLILKRESISSVKSPSKFLFSSFNLSTLSKSDESKKEKGSKEIIKSDTVSSSSSSDSIAKQTKGMFSSLVISPGSLSSKEKGKNADKSLHDAGNKVSELQSTKKLSISPFNISSFSNTKKNDIKESQRLTLDKSKSLTVLNKPSINLNDVSLSKLNLEKPFTSSSNVPAREIDEVVSEIESEAKTVIKILNTILSNNNFLAGVMIICTLINFILFCIMIYKK
jgi:hypothetical protein